jgi:aminoglycoside phosphotransferase (APT) family kinase protein
VAFYQRSRELVTAVGGSLPHGFALDPADHRLLRSRPPARALDWVVESLGAARLLRVHARSGGTSSAVHMLHLEHRGGGRIRLVLRRYVRAEWLAEEPDLAAREADALRCITGCPLPVPGLVAVDPTGEQAGDPALLMTALPGRVDWAPRDLDAWLSQQVRALPAIHGTRIPQGIAIRPYRPYELGKELGPPVWTRYPRAWRRAIDAYQGPPPSVERVLLHRDYHPGNVLWRGGRLTGVVDWANASIGPPEADVGHCRANLAGHLGSHVADDFLKRWLALTGRTSYHPYWDIVVTVGPTESFGAKPDPDLDAWIARAAAELE